MITDGADRSPVGRRRWRTVALPTEHGGWSLTAEPAVLGLAVAWSGSGLALAGAAMLGFVARTPVKVVLVDRWRGRRLARTALAHRIALVELAALVGLVVVAALTGDGRFWIPLAIAAPLIAIELRYDMMSRSRRLVPELAGSVGIGSVAAAIALSGGTTVAVAGGLWCVIGARSGAAIPFVRYQIARTKTRRTARWPSDVAQLVAIGAAVVGWVVDAVPAASVVAIVGLAIVHVGLARTPPSSAVVVGVQQTVLGAVVIAVTATAVRLG